MFFLILNKYSVVELNFFERSLPLHKLAFLYRREINFFSTSLICRKSISANPELMVNILFTNWFIREELFRQNLLDSVHLLTQ